MSGRALPYSYELDELLQLVDLSSDDVSDTAVGQFVLGACPVQHARVKPPAADDAACCCDCIVDQATRPRHHLRLFVDEL